MMINKRLFPRYCLPLLAAAAVFLLAACAQTLPTDAESGRPALVFLSPASAPELWRVAADGGEAVQLTDTGGTVFDYAVSRDGQWIVYAAGNNQGGLDLWLLETISGKSKMLLECGAERCLEADWSADGELLAFTRQGRRQSEVWTISRSSAQTQPLIAAGNLGASSPSWSPDGRWIAMVETQTGQIRIVDLQDGENIRLPSTLGLMGSWSPNGRQMIYLDMNAAELFAGVDLYLVDVETRQIEPLLISFGDDAEMIVDEDEEEHEEGEEHHDDERQTFSRGKMDAAVPVWHPTEALLLIAQRPLYGSYSKQLWLVSLTGDEPAIALTNDQNFAHAAYRWSPDGQMVVFQRFPLDAAGAAPEVWVWNREDGSLHLMAEDAALPSWLP